MFDNKYIQLALAYNLFTRIKNDDFEYVYRGIFSQDIIKKIVYLADTNIQRMKDKSTIQKRIYSIMVEGLQNITRHQSDQKDILDKYPGIFVIQKQKGKFYVSTGNLINTDHTDFLERKIQKINSLGINDLKIYHKEMLIAGELSDKGGAGLGLIEMARKSGNKLSHDFKKIDSQFSYFYLQIEVPSGDEDLSKPSAPSSTKLSAIKKLHELLNKENILLNFNGLFTQENVLNLISIVKGRLETSITTIKLSNIMVEMLQNIGKHGENRNMHIDGNPGIFFISQKNNDFILNSGNFIKNSMVDVIKGKIEFVNSLDYEELNDYYDNILLDLENVTSKSAGLGLVDMRIKSQNLLNYDFYEVDNDYSFYTIQAVITTK